jgi:colanic acid/amylovoran biosynthesis glycosyltransferase
VEQKVSRQVDALIQQLDLGACVTQASPVIYANLQQEYSQAHVFVLASHTDSHGETEGVPTALLEAQACGLPVVSTRHAGIPGVLDGKSGFLVPERDSELLAERLLWLIGHPEGWERMGRAGRAFVEQEYNAKIQAARLESIYEKLIHNHYS